MKTIVFPSDNLQQICDNAKPNDTIVLTQGVYKCKLILTVPCITLEASDMDKTVIEYDDCANKIHADGKQFNTFRTFSVAVCAENIKMRGLTIKNSTVDPKTNGQCVALSINAGGFDMKDCKIVSTQDSLFCGPLPDDLILRYQDFLPQNLRIFVGKAVQRFENCQIVGSVDFIFGCGHAIFDKCQIISVNDGRKIGFVAAPAHCSAQDKGFEFFDCQFLSTGDVLPKSVYLARPWRDFGKCEFSNCSFGGHISPQLFCFVFGDVDRSKTARFDVF